MNLRAHRASKKPLEVLAFDEPRFGLITWHKRRYCPKAVRPPWIVQHVYKWSWLYAAVEPTTGESFCLYLPHLDANCFEVFLEHLSRAYPEHRLVLVLDNAPAHLAGGLELPENITLLPLPTYSPELNPVERWFEEFRRALANIRFESIDALHRATTRVIEPYWHDPAKLGQLTGFPWWRKAVEQL
ncbi:MAG TPA: IS630 family transposase [Rubrobacteraceae bacterium]|nr:IS630 family transposase [Rubrobacteraceae bacterium]